MLNFVLTCEVHEYLILHIWSQITLSCLRPQLLLLVHIPISLFCKDNSDFTNRVGKITSGPNMTCILFLQTKFYWNTAMAAFQLHKQSCVVAQTVQPTNPKIVTSQNRAQTLKETSALKKNLRFYWKTTFQNHRRLSLYAIDVFGTDTCKYYFLISFNFVKLQKAHKKE